MRKIVIDVEENGAFSIDYHHFEGAECLAESQRFHDLLANQFGLQIQTEHKKPKPELLLAQAEGSVQLPVQEHHLEAETEG